jgi:hypothetical protein
MATSTATAEALGLTEDDLAAVVDAAGRWRDAHDVLLEQSAADMAEFSLGDPGRFVPDRVDRPKRKRRRRRGRRSS